MQTVLCFAGCLLASRPLPTSCWYHLPTLAGILIIKNVSRNYQMSHAGRSSRAKSWPVENHYLSEKFFRCKPQNFLIYHPRGEFLPFLFASIAWDRGLYKKNLNSSYDAIESSHHCCHHLHSYCSCAEPEDLCHQHSTLGHHNHLVGTAPNF